MKHIIKLIYLSEKWGRKPTRNFKATIDEISISGQVKHIYLGSVSPAGIYKCAYRFKLPKELISHPDYKNIRRVILKLMIERDSAMQSEAIR